MFSDRLLVIALASLASFFGGVIWAGLWPDLKWRARQWWVRRKQRRIQKRWAAVRGQGVREALR